MSSGRRRRTPLRRGDGRGHASRTGACERKRVGTGRVTIGGESLPLTPLIGRGGLIFQASDAVFHGKLSRASGRYGSKLRGPLLNPGPTLSDIHRRSSSWRASRCSLRAPHVPEPLRLILERGGLDPALGGARELLLDHRGD